ncbi:unnamed protein product [Leptosia nina]|uniref:Uncharacterized protein n=1 Tax=Leptosia nina TaxID=320188 RepID=A0AAV1JDB4_9NEOP
MKNPFHLDHGCTMAQQQQGQHKQHVFAQHNTADMLFRTNSDFEFEFLRVADTSMRDGIPLATNASVAPAA